MRTVDIKEVIHGLYHANIAFRDVRDAGEYLATHFFNDDEIFEDDDVAIAIDVVKELRTPPITKATGGFYDFDAMLEDRINKGEAA